MASKSSRRSPGQKLNNLQGNVIRVYVVWKVGRLPEEDEELHYELGEDEMKELTKVLGDGKARVSSGYTSGISSEVDLDQGKRAWIKADAHVDIQLTCGQTAGEVLDAAMLAQKLALEAELASLDTVFRRARNMAKKVL